MKITLNNVVAFDYTLFTAKGEVLDSSQNSGPLEYLHGAGNIVPGLEKAMEGLEVGDERKVVVAPADGYGEHNPKLVVKVSREQFAAADNVSPGMRFQALLSDGRPHVMTVLSVADDGVVLDGNHELAGVELHFEIKIVSIRAATESEIGHGHPHHEHTCCGGHGHGGDHCCSHNHHDC